MIMTSVLYTVLPQFFFHVSSFLTIKTARVRQRSACVCVCVCVGGGGGGVVVGDGCDYVQSELFYYSLICYNITSVSDSEKDLF